MNAIEKYKQKKKEMSEVIGGAMKRRADEAVQSGLSEIRNDVDRLYNSHSVLDKDWAGAQTFRNLKDERDSVISKTEDIKKWLTYSSYSAEEKSEYESWINQIQGAIDSKYAIKDSSSEGQENSALSLDEYAKQKQEYYGRYLDPVDFAKWSALESGSLENLNKYIEDAKAEGYVKRPVRYGYKVNTDEYIRQADIDRAQNIYDAKKYTQSVGGKTLAQIYENAYTNFDDNHGEYSYLSDIAATLERDSQEYGQANEWLNAKKSELENERGKWQDELNKIPLIHDNVHGHAVQYYDSDNQPKAKEIQNKISQINKQIEAVGADLEKISKSSHISQYRSEFENLPQDIQELISQEVYYTLVGEYDPRLLVAPESDAREKYMPDAALNVETIQEYADEKGYQLGKSVRDLIEQWENVAGTDAKNAEISKKQEFANEHPVLASLSSIPTSLASGIAAIPELIRAKVEGGRGDGYAYGVHDYSAAFAPTRYTKSVRNTVAAGIESDAGKFVYQTAMSTLDSAAAMALGVGAGAAFGTASGASAAVTKRIVSGTTNFIMSSSAGANAIYEGLEKGYSSEKAVTLGVISGVIEAASEKFSIDTILNSAGNDAFWKTVAKSFAAEGSEEVVSNWGNKIVDAISNKSQAEIYQSILSYQDKGYTSGQALSRAIFDSLGEDSLAFLAGGISGAAMGSVAQLGGKTVDAIGSHIGNAVDTHEISRSALKNDGGARLIEEALKLPEGSPARELAMQYAEGGKKNGKDMSRADAKTMVRAVNKNLREQMSAYTESAAKKVIADELTSRYGITETDGLSVMTTTAYRALTGQELSREEREIYEQSEKVREIVQDMRSDPDGKFARFFSDVTTDATLSALEQAAQTREAIAGVESAIVRPYIGKGNQKVVRGTQITAINSDGTFEMSTVDNKGGDAGKVTISTDDLSSRVRAIYDTVIESTDNAEIANAVIQAAATDRRVVSQISPEIVTAVSDIARSGLSLSDRGIAMFAGVNSAAWERAGDTLKQAIYSAAQKNSSDTGAVYSSVTREDVVRAYSAEGKLGTKQAADTMLRLIDGIGKQYGVQIMFADLAKGYQGGHISGTNRIVLGLDINEGLLTRTLGHEMFHYLKELNPTLAGGLQSDVIAWLKKNGKYDAVYERFENDYEMNTEGMTETEKRAYLEEEIAADSCFDALSNDRFLNDFHAQTAKKKGGETFLEKLADFFRSLAQLMQDTVRRFVNSHVNNELVRALSQDAKMLDHINERFAELLSTAKTQENKKASAETQGEAKFQKIGINKDGIEVYEISAETKRLPFKERKKHFLSLMKNEYRGRTAKFEKNGQVYYAAFEDADIQKNIYGDKKSDAKGYKAKINAGADGDIFDLVEKSKYNGSGKEIGKQTAAHKNISNWDYFIKTVQIGKGVFDLVANVRRRNNGAFVYSIQLNANKKTTASPPKVDNTATVKRVLNAVVNNSISNPDEIVKRFDEKNSSNPDEVVEPSDEENSSGVGNQTSAEKYSYNKLISKPDMFVTRISDKTVYQANKSGRKNIVDRAIKNVKQIGGVNEYGSAFVYVNDIKSDVVVTRKSIEHSLDRRLNIMGAVSKNIGSILQNSIRINELNPRTDNIDESYVLIGCAMNQDGNPYIVRSVVNKYSNELSSMDVLYAVNAKKEPAALVAPRVTNQSLSITDSTISISDLLDFVNRYFPDILPEDVLRHYGYAKRPDGVLGKSVLFQKSADSVRDEELRMIRQDYELTKLQNDLMRAKLKVYEHKVPSPKALRRYLNNVIKWYGVQYNDAEKLQAFEKLSEIYKYLVQSKTPNMATVQDMAFDLARDMIDYSAELIKEPYSDAERDLRRTLRETGLCLSEAQKSEIIYSYGSMTNFRRATGGMIRINYNSRLYVADIMREAKEIYDIKTDNEDEFLVELIPYMKASAEAARGVWADPYQGDAKAAHMAAMDLSSLLLDALFDPNIVPARRTFADIEEEKRYRALLNQYSYYEKRMAKLNDRVRQARAEGRQAVKNERGRREAAIKKMAEHYAQMTYKAQERRKSSETRAKLDRLINQMNARLFSPKENRYVPQDMQCAVIGVLEAANRFDGDRAERLARYDQMINAASGEHRDELERIRKVVADGGQSIGDAIGAVKEIYKAYEPKEDGTSPNTIQGAAYDPFVTKLLERAEKELKGLNASELNSAQLEVLYRAVRATEKVVSDAIKLKDSRIKKDVYEAGRALIRETRAIKGKKGGIASGFLQLMLTPRVFFERLGGFAKDSMWVKLYEDLNDAQREMLDIKMQGTLIFDGIISGKENAEALRAMVSEKNAVDIGLTDADGNAIKLTHDQLISLYLHMQNEDNRRHMESGGISIRTKNGKIRAVGVGQKLIEANNLKNDAQRRISALNMQEATERWQRLSDEEKRRLYDERQNAEKQLAEAEREIERIRKEHAAGIEDLRDKVEKALTDYDRAWVDAAKKFFHYSASLLDEVTYDRYGFHRDLIDSYYPIGTDSDFRKTEIENFGNEATLDGMGFLKDRIISYNPLVLVGVTDTVIRHLDGISKYAGMSGAIDNFKKLYNMIDSGYSDSVKNAINDVFGKKNGSEYLEKIISDMQELSADKTDLFHQVTAILRGGLAASSLTLNPRVALLQTASYPTAAAELGFKALARALARKDGDSLPVFSRADQELIAKYSPLLWYRLQGYGTESINGLSDKAKPLQKIKDNPFIKKGLLGWINAMDAATVGRLWYAAQYYVDDNFEYLKHGSDEWYREVANAFNRTVERTQPNYTALQRTAIARSKNEFAKAFSMFTTQRFQNFNIAYSSAARLMRYQYDFGKGLGGVTKSDLRQARKSFARSLSALIAAGVDIAISRVLVQAILHNLKAYRDDDDELTAKSIAAATAAYFAESMSSNVLFGSEVYKIIDHWMAGGTYYTPELSGIGTALDLLKDTAQVGGKLIDAVTGRSDDGDQWKKVTKSAQQIVSDLCAAFGIPARNIGMILSAVDGHISSIKGVFDGTIDGKWTKYFDDDLELTNKEIVKLTDKRGKNPSETGARLFELYSSIEDEEKKSKFKSDAQNYFKSKFEENPGEWSDIWDSMQRSKIWKGSELNVIFRGWKYKIETGEDFSKGTDLYNAIRDGEGIEEAMEEYKTFSNAYTAEEDTVKALKSQVKNNYIDGNIDRQTAIEYLRDYAGDNNSKARDTLASWDKAITRDDIKERFFSEELDDGEAISALCRAGYKRSEAEDYVNKWTADMSRKIKGQG